MMRNKGFTLVEILIVVIILGILAAIVIPQFTEASNEGRQSRVLSDLQTLRSQIELYKIQHKDALPPSASSAEFWTALTTRTDADGNAGGDFGPYVQQPPVNPFAAGGSVVGIDAANAPDPAAAGWWFNPATGEFRAVGEDKDGNDLADF